MFRLIFKVAAPLPKVKNFKRMLFIGAHPDDIEVGCGASVAKFAAEGKDIQFLILTDGGVGAIDPTIPETELVQIRQKESLASAKLLGVNNVKFLSFHDGNDYDLKEVEKEIIRTIVEFKPDVIFTIDPNCPTETHPDHINCGKASMNAMTSASWPRIVERFGIHDTHRVKTIAFYYTNKPNQYVRVRKYEKLKMDAIRCHKTQYGEEMLHTLGLYFKIRDFRFGLRCFSLKAEGFKVLGPLHLHAFPEASEY